MTMYSLRTTVPPGANLRINYGLIQRVQGYTVMVDVSSHSLHQVDDGTDARFEEPPLLFVITPVHYARGEVVHTLSFYHEVTDVLLSCTGVGGVGVYGGVGV